MRFSDLREAIEFMERNDELLIIDKEVSTNCEIGSISKALDGYKAILFTNVKETKTKIITNIFSDRNRVGKFFDYDPVYLCKRFYEASLNPIPPKIVEDAPVMENSITKDVDLSKVIPPMKVTPMDTPNITIGGSIVMFQIPETGEIHMSYQRLSITGKDEMSIGITPGRDIETVLMRLRKEGGKLPITINIGGPPAFLIAACGYRNKLGLAGALNGEAMKITRGRTVDCYFLSNAEFVIEGYIDTTQTTFEHPELAKSKEERKNFFPEYLGYYGTAYKTFKVKATAIHYRNDPIYYYPLADSLDTVNLVRIPIEAEIYGLCKEIGPDVIDCVYSLDGMRAFHGMVIRVKKSLRRHEGLQVKFMLAAVSISKPPSCRLVIAVDEDVDVTSAEDVIWAICNRADFKNRSFIVPVGGALFTTGVESTPNALLIDATVPFEEKAEHVRAKYMKVDINKYLSEEEIAKARIRQNEYVKKLARISF